MTPNIPETNQTRIVIVGAGFGGLALAQKLAKHDVQIVLIDKNNYHQFQPLFYQRPHHGYLLMCNEGSTRMSQQMYPSCQHLF